MSEDSDSEQQTKIHCDHCKRPSAKVKRAGGGRCDRCVARGVPK